MNYLLLPHIAFFVVWLCVLECLPVMAQSSQQSAFTCGEAFISDVEDSYKETGDFDAIIQKLQLCFNIEKGFENKTLRARAHRLMALSYYFSSPRRDSLYQDHLGKMVLADRRYDAQPEDGEIFINDLKLKKNKRSQILRTRNWIIGSALGTVAAVATIIIIDNSTPDPLPGPPTDPLPPTTSN